MNEGEKTYAESIVNRPNVGDDLWTNDEEHKRRAIMDSNEMRNDCIDVKFQVHKCEQSSKASDRIPLQVGFYIVYKENHREVAV